MIQEFFQTTGFVNSYALRQSPKVRSTTKDSRMPFTKPTKGTLSDVNETERAISKIIKRKNCVLHGTCVTRRHTASWHRPTIQAMAVADTVRCDHHLS